MGLCASKPNQSTHSAHLQSSPVDGSPAHASSKEQSTAGKVRQRVLRQLSFKPKGDTVRAGGGEGGESQHEANVCPDEATPLGSSKLLPTAPVRVKDALSEELATANEVSGGSTPEGTGDGNINGNGNDNRNSKGENKAAQSPPERTFRANFKKNANSSKGDIHGSSSVHSSPRSTPPLPSSSSAPGSGSLLRPGKSEKEKSVPPSPSGEGKEGGSSWQAGKSWFKKEKKVDGGEAQPRVGISQEAPEGGSSGSKRRMDENLQRRRNSLSAAPDGASKSHNPLSSSSNTSKLLNRSPSGGLMKILGESLGDIGLTLEAHYGGPGSGAIRQKASRSSRIDIVAFEIANIIVRCLTFKTSLQDDDINELEAEVLSSEGVRCLVSKDDKTLWAIAAEDKRLELRSVAREVARLGRLSGDPSLDSLEQSLKKLGTEGAPAPKLSAEDMDAEFKNLEMQAQSTAELYHELNNLKSLEQAYNRRLKNDEGAKKEKGSGDKDYLASMKNEVKAQEKTVRALKRKGLWTKRLDSVVEKLRDAIIHLHARMVTVFAPKDVTLRGLMDPPHESEEDNKKLGVLGMATHFANIINVIDGLVMRPFSYDRIRDNLYSMLSPSLRFKLKRGLGKSKSIEDIDTETLQENMENILDWLVIMGGNTLRYSADRRLQGHTDLTLLQTLHHAKKEETEDLIVHLLVHLNHFVSRSQKEGEPVRSPVPTVVLKTGGNEATVKSDIHQLLLKSPASNDAASGDSKDNDAELGEEWSRKPGKVVDTSQAVAEEVESFLGTDSAGKAHPRLLISISENSTHHQEGMDSELSAVPAEPSPTNSTTPPAIAAYKNMLGDLPPDKLDKLASLALGRNSGSRGISKSLNFFPGQKGGLAALRKAHGITEPSENRVVSLSRAHGQGMQKDLEAMKEREKMLAFSPRTNSRSLSRSVTFTSLLANEPSHTPRVRPMTPATYDVDGLGKEEDEVIFTHNLSL